MPNYADGVIYKIFCKDVNVNEIYVGSSTNFAKRKNAHKSLCNNINGIKYNINVYQFIREHGGWENWDIDEIEKYSANDRIDLQTRERYFIETLGASLNICIPTRTTREKAKEYYKNNKDSITKKAKEYYKNKGHFAEQKKKYYQKNKESITVYNKEYNKNNKDSITEKAKQPILCDCGSTLRLSDKARHLRTLKHIRWQTLYDFVYS